MTKRSLAGKPTIDPADDSIAAHFGSGDVMHFSKRDTIINDFDEPKGVYLIKEGFVKACSISRNGHGNLLFIHEAGAFIPLPWALDGAHTTGLSYEAMTDVTVLRGSKEKLRDALGSNTWLSKEILRQAVDVISVYTQRIQTLEYRSSRDRVISELLNLSERFGVQHGKKVLINVPVTHQDIADSINMIRETASRAILKLTSEGLLSQENHLFAILDLPKMQQALN